MGRVCRLVSPRELNECILFMFLQSDMGQALIKKKSQKELIFHVAAFCRKGFSSAVELLAKVKAFSLSSK